MKDEVGVVDPGFGDAVQDFPAEKDQVPVEFQGFDFRVELLHFGPEQCKYFYCHDYFLKF